MAITTYKAVDGTITKIGKGDPVYERETSQSGSVSYIDIGSLFDNAIEDNTMVVIKIPSALTLTYTNWRVTFTYNGGSSYGTYPIRKQDGTNFGGNIAAGTYLLLMTDRTNTQFVLLGSADVPVASTTNLGIVQPDGTTVLIDANGVISVAGGSGDAYPLTQAQMEALEALI